MTKDTRFHDKKEQKISAIQPTDERMTGRAGLALFEAYIRNIQILPLIDCSMVWLDAQKQQRSCHH